MVSRKPVPPTQGQSDTTPLPYPASPITTKPNQSFSQTSNAAGRRPYPLDEEDDQSINPWQDVQRPSDISEDWEHTERKNGTDEVATSPKQQRTPSPGYNDSDLPNQIRSGLRELTPQSSWERDSEASFEQVSAKPNLDAPAHAPPPPPPQSQDPSRPVVDTNPYRARSTERAVHLPMPREEDSSNIWAEIAQDSKPPATRQASVPVAELDGMALEDKAGWDTVQRAHVQATPAVDSPLIEFDHAEDYKKELEATPFGPPEGMEDLNHGNAGDQKGKTRAFVIPGDEDAGFQPPPGPPPPKSAEKFHDRKITVPEEVANKQRNETYQIKHVRWADSNSHEIRTSPILIQNKNGPCPLMALVNALTLSTPPDLNTALTETLRVREQISLGLLLDAVFDELMSGRRGDAAQGLPDVSELYAFLITLHTGMNVNPRFIPAKRQEQSLMDGTFQEVPLTVEDYRKPGTFEETKEMMLYGTFSIPLIHGWLPPKSYPAFESIERSAVTYEDAQNLMFREEELEDKVQSSGLDPVEQQLLQDIGSIKYFLSSTATQLTGHGLETINEALQPGSIAILFRNDHFGTLYKQPRTGQLLLLVTDAGYSTHEEIVWETLIDVSGEGSEFLSGDFRPVGGNPGQSQAFDQGGADGPGWTTVSKNKGRKLGHSDSADTGQPSNNQYEQPPSSPSGRNHEQEDADLALALQLQEEEEENSRRTAAQRRQQEEAATSQYLANSQTNGSPNTARGPGSPQQSSQNIQPLLPPRRNTSAINSRPAVHREDTTADDAPPSYEQASKAEPYLGPDPSQTSLANSVSHGSTSSRPGPSNTTGRPRGQSAYSLNSSHGNYPSSPGGNARRRSGAPSAQDAAIGVTRRRNSGANDRDKDCIVM